jgi:diacyltrehalose acyltransferase
MKKLLAGVVAAGLLGSAGGLGAGLAAAETAYVVGGARGPGIPWWDYTNRAGRGYYPNANRVIVDYPAGMLYGQLPKLFGPTASLATTSPGESIATGAENLDAAIKGGSGPAVSIGLSEGTLVLDTEQARLANDPAAPPPDQLSFTVFSDPTRGHGFGHGFMAMFDPGTYFPIVGVTQREHVESQYDTNVVVAEYDGVADFPDRPTNLLSVANAIFGAHYVHTPAAFTSPADVPPENIRSSTNSRGGTTTTFMLPSPQLPLTMPLRELGLHSEADQLDQALRPIVDEGYSRTDYTSTPVTTIDPEGQANIKAAMETIKSLLPPGIG